MAKLPHIDDATKQEIWHWYWVAELPVEEIRQVYGLPIHPPVYQVAGGAGYADIKCPVCDNGYWATTRDKLKAIKQARDDGHLPVCDDCKAEQKRRFSRPRRSSHQARRSVSEGDYAEYLQTEQWQVKRLQALMAADHRCRVCNSPERLDVHHRTYERLGHEQPGDLTVLCRECHEMFHSHRKLTRRSAA